MLVVVSYFLALQGGFVWDDLIFAEEPAILSPGALRSIWFSPADIKNEGHYWPLVYTSFWLEHRLWGLQPAGYHAVNILLHVLNCLLPRGSGDRSEFALAYAGMGRSLFEAQRYADALPALH